MVVPSIFKPIESVAPRKYRPAPAISNVTPAGVRLIPTLALVVSTMKTLSLTPFCSTSKAVVEFPSIVKPAKVG